MGQSMWFSLGGARVREAVEAGFDGCEQGFLVSRAPGAEQRDDAFWKLVARHGERMRGAILSDLESAEPTLLAGLHDAGRLRRVAAGAALPGHFITFERGDELQLLLASDALGEASMTGAVLWLCWQGPKAALPEGLQATLDECWSSSIAVGPTQLVGGRPAASATATYARPIPSVREVLGIRAARDFFELDPPAQELALWSALIGEGSVDLDRAIRLCAERLRAQGFLEYRALRQDGPVYAAIEERLLAARRSTELFDRPRNGFVRAIRSKLDELTAEQWRDCVMGALSEGDRVDRDYAVRLGFAQAQEVYGVDAQRLRVHGKADQALRSAINSAIRQGYLARDGAAYLIRVAPPAEPALRGALASVEAEEQAPTNERIEAVVELAVVEAAVVEETVEEIAAQEPHAVDPSSPLDRKLWELDFPTRTLNWAERQGIKSLCALVAWRPDAFAQERNVGRRTVRETRERIEATLGCSWEEAHVAVLGDRPPIAAAAQGDDEEVDATTEALTAGGSMGWARLVVSLTERQRSVQLEDIPLPTRMRNFVRAEGLATLGELLGCPYATLVSAPNLGRKSLNDTLDAVHAHLAELVNPTVHASFLQAWQAQLSALQPIERMIVTRRAGMHGTRETLEELGGMLGVSRERVRQIESVVVERLRERTRLCRAIREHLATAFGAGRALPLELLAQDPWWVGVDEQGLLLDYMVRRLFEGELSLIDAPSGRRYLSKFPPDAFAERLESAKQRVAKLEYPVELQVIEAILRSEAEPLDPIVFVDFEQAVGELLLIDPDRQGMALGYGRHRDDEIVAFLSGQPSPVPVGLVEERFGRGHFPELVLYFRRGVVGLKRHFPDFDAWSERLVPAALDVMSERPAGRQWLVPELHDALRERGLMPDWLGHWHLASLLRLSGQVDYLGRLRVASRDSGNEQRLQYEDLLEQLLDEAGGPLDFDELLRRARVRTDIPETSAGLLLAAPPFVRLDERRVGLVERDIPGGPSAVAAAIELVVHTLDESQQGLTPHQATQLVMALSEVHAIWTRPLVTSVLRGEASIRIDRSKNIGLDAWDDVRCPTRPEFVRREVQRAGGALSLGELRAKLESFYGRAPDRNGLGMLATQIGLAITGDTISRPASIALEAPIPGVGLSLAGIPAELRELFEGLVRESLSEVEPLRAQVCEHLEVMEVEHRVSEFVDVQGARLLAQQCELLLERWETFSMPERHLAHAAVRYFVSWNDVEHDLNTGGLDDDKQIMAAVLAHLGF